VPAIPKKKSSFDAEDGYHTTDARVIDLYSSADGGSNGHALRNIIIIGAIAGGLYYAYKRGLFN
jgi:hypothetical protein